MVRLFGKNITFSFGSVPPTPVPSVTPSTTVKPLEALLSGNYYGSGEGAQHSILDGEKFIGGFGATQLHITDYWTLRQRSTQLFNDNLYARGLIRRLITNEINTGLAVEALPEELILGVDEDSMSDWSEEVESRFSIWGAQPKTADHKKLNNFGAIQRMVRRESLIGGDVLVILRVSRNTKVPSVQIISSSSVETPLDVSGLKKGHKIEHGVELDGKGRQVAYWIRQKDLTHKRQPAIGGRSGRRLAWLVYGCEHRIGDVRGVPLLGIILQSLKEIDRYRDSAQRKAVINSILAMYIKKTEDKIGTLPIQNGAVRHDTVDTENADGSPRSFNLAGQIPGVVYEELQQGEEPVGFHSQGTDVDFKKFEEAIIHAIAWANEMPAEILTLSFNSNYSASQAAINEFKMYLNKVRSEFGASFCQPIYEEWLITQILIGKISANGLLTAWRDPSQIDVYGAWMMTDWSGAIKPSTDLLKQAKGNQILVAEGWMTNARSARELTGTKFRKNISLLKKENELKADAIRPMLELRKEFGETEVSNAEDKIEDVVKAAMEAQEDG